MATTESAPGLYTLSRSLLSLSLSRSLISACFPPFSRSLAASSWPLPILVPGACLFLRLIVFLPGCKMEEERRFCMRGGRAVVLSKHTEVCALSSYRSSSSSSSLSLSIHALIFSLVLCLFFCFLVLPPVVCHTNRVHWERSYHWMVVSRRRKVQSTSLSLSLPPHM